MNIVVTGATSFLGAALTKRLLSEGHQVYAVVRPGSKNLGALLEAVRQSLPENGEAASHFHRIEGELVRTGPKEICSIRTLKTEKKPFWEQEA